MKRILVIIAIVAVVLAAAFYGMRSYTRLASPKETLVYNKDGLNIQVNYCRPSKKGRAIFGELEPYGKVWRTGANEATEITFSQAVRIGDKPLQAGTYAMFTVPEPDQWTFILNSELGQWGAFTYNESKDVLRVKVPASQTPEVTEKFTIAFQEVSNRIDMVLLWDQTKIAVPIYVSR